MGPSRRTVGGALLVAAGALALWRSHDPAPPNPGGPARLGLRPDTPIEYEARLHTHGWVAPGAGLAALAPSGPRGAPGRERLPLDVVLSGRLAFRVVAFDAGTQAWSLEARLRSPHLVLNGTPAPDAPALQEPLPLRVHLDGRLELVEAAPPAGVDRLALRTLVRGFSLRLAPDDAPAWTAREEADDGAWRVAYQWIEAPPPMGPWRLRKTWHAYEAPDSPAGAGVPLKRTITLTRGGLTLGPGPQWIERLDLELGAEERLAGTPVARWRTRWRAVRVASDPAPAAPFATPAGPGTPAHATRAPQAPEPAPAPAPAAQPADLDAVVGAFLDRAPGRYPEARDALLLALRRHAALPRALAEWLEEADAGLPEAEALRLWRLLAEAGSPSAQAALAAVLAGDGYGPQSVERALAHAPLVPDPGPTLLQALWQLADTPAFAADSDPIAVRALLAVGALGAGPHTSPEGARAVAAGLIRRLARAEAGPARLPVLLAIGNLGHADTLVAVAPLLRDADPATRAAAAAALRRVQDPDAGALLRTAFDREPDPQVRGAILGALAERGLDPTTRAWALAHLRPGADAGVLAGLVRLLAPAAPADEAVRRALRALLDAHPPRDVRRALYEALGPPAAPR